MDPAILSQPNSMASPASSQATTLTEESVDSLPNCTECEAPATTEVRGDDDRSYSLCGVCDAHFRETVAELESHRSGLYSEDHTAIRMCDDCHQKVARREFSHMRKGTFFLCHHCFAWADHEDDYLDYCDCMMPVGDPADTECLACRRGLRPTTTYCECPTPTVVGSCRIECRECCARIRYT